MLLKFQSPEVLTLYEIRSRSVEPVIGQIKEVDGLRRFLRRGIRANRTDFRLAPAAHNLKKLWRGRVKTLRFIDHGSPAAAYA
jgi:hypothetical protein